MYFILINLLIFAHCYANVYKLDKLYSNGKICKSFSDWKLVEDPNLFEGYRIEPSNTLSCVTTSEFYVTNGLLEVTVRIESKGIEDRVSIILIEENIKENAVLARIDLLPTPGTEEVETRKVYVKGTGRLGYVVLLGEASNKSSIIIESLKFKSNEPLNKATLADKILTKLEIPNESDSMMIYTGAPDRLSTVTLNPGTLPSPTTTPEPTTTEDYTGSTDTETYSTDFESTTDYTLYETVSTTLDDTALELVTSETIPEVSSSETTSSSVASTSITSPSSSEFTDITSYTTEDFTESDTEATISPTPSSSTSYFDRSSLFTVIIVFLIRFVVIS